MSGDPDRPSTVILKGDFPHYEKLVERIYWSEPDPAVRMEYLRSLSELFREKEKRPQTTRVFRSFLHTIQTSFAKEPGDGSATERRGM